jgi:hypothetical protein
MRRGAALVALVAAVACAPADEPVTGGAARAIIGGSANDGRDPAVALLLSRRGRTLISCTASMITRRVVMTAAHCIDGPADSREIWLADSFDSSTGQFTGLLDDERRVAIAQRSHPSWTADSFTAGFDIALLLLDKPIPESVAPLPWSRTRLTRGNAGDEVRMVGFGVTAYESESTLHAKLTATNTLANLGVVFDVQGQTSIACQGDSGGPAFMRLAGGEVVAGITSYTDLGCAQFAAFARVDLYLDFIDAFLAEHDPQAPTGCAADGVCGLACAAVDPDCPCVGDGHCVAACATPAEDPDCPEGCGAGNGCLRTGCPVADPDCGDKVLGEACSSADECLGGVCAAYDDGRVCSEPCGHAGACPAASRCASNLCLPERTGGCQVGARGATWWGALALLALLTPRRSRPRVEAALAPAGSGLTAARRAGSTEALEAHGVHPAVAVSGHRAGGDGSGLRAREAAQ